MNKSVLQLITVLTVLMGTSLPLHAIIELGDYRKLTEDKSATSPLIFYVTGAGDGISLANSLIPKGQPLLFCRPETARLDAQDYKLILDQEIKAGDYPAASSITKILLQGLKKVFPCRK